MAATKIKSYYVPPLIPDNRRLVEKNLCVYVPSICLSSKFSTALKAQSGKPKVTQASTGTNNEESTELKKLTEKVKRITTKHQKVSCFS